MRAGYCAAKIAPDSAFQGARGVTSSLGHSEGDVKTNTRRTVNEFSSPPPSRPSLVPTLSLSLFAPIVPSPCLTRTLANTESLVTRSMPCGRGSAACTAQQMLRFAMRPGLSSSRSASPPPNPTTRYAKIERITPDGQTAGQRSEELCLFALLSGIRQALRPYTRKGY